MESTRTIQSATPVSKDSWTYSKQNYSKEWAKKNRDKLRENKRRWRERQKEKKNGINN